MLVQFSVSNWKSFRDQVTFSMIASRERQHGQRLSRLDKHQIRILPITVLYGGNASGKTNLCDALAFAQRLVCTITKPNQKLPVEPFLLDDTGVRQPSKFMFEILVGKDLYEFSFALTRNEILEEKLVKITSSRERVLYDRQEKELNLDPSLKEIPFLEFAFRGTRSNQLFLTNSVSQDVETFRPVYDWFDQILTILDPRSKPVPYPLYDDQDFWEKTSRLLSDLDTGIVELGEEELPAEELLSEMSLREETKSQIMEDVEEGKFIGIPTDSGHIVLVTLQEDRLVAQKLVSYHSRADGTTVKFDIHQESAGTQRLIDLLPAFLDLMHEKTRKVYVIDEIDSSLHTQLTIHLLEMYLSQCSTLSRGQLLLTTHDLLLMDQDLLRRDEIWVVERDASNTSQLISLSEYADIDKDTNIRKRYLQGRLGGIPVLLPSVKLVEDHQYQ